MKIAGKNRFFVYNLVVLTVIFTYFLLKKYSNDDLENIFFSPGSLLISIMICSSMLISHYSSRSKNLTSLVNLRTFLYSLLFGLAIMLLTDLLTLVLERFFGMKEHFTFRALLYSWPARLYRILEGSFIFYLYKLFLHFDHLRKNLIYHQRKVHSLKNDLKETRLQALRSQLDPHFLFNAMNSIAMMVRTKKYNESIGMIANLNELLRISLGRSAEHLVSLEEELNILDKYLQIELIRFGDRVNPEILIDEKTTGAIVPQLILQPLVENAFKHGLSNDMGQQHLCIMSAKEQDKLVLVVKNNTSQSTLPDLRHSEEDHKTGLRNIKERLQRLYGSQFKFQVRQPDGEIEFRIMIPFQT